MSSDEPEIIDVLKERLNLEETTSAVSTDDSFEKITENENFDERILESIRSRWIQQLGVASRPSPSSFEWDHLFNLRSQSALRAECRLLAKRLNNTRSVPELESFFTLYCKMRSMDFAKDEGWIETYEKIHNLAFNNDVLYNIFYSVTTKFVPRDTRKSSAIFDLFRLLLQYHDPAVCTKLETFKCQPHAYAREWFSTLFAKFMDNAVCHELWTLYFARGDAFVIFFMGLVLIVNARDAILKLNDVAELTSFIRNLPCSLTKEDVNDFFELSAFYASQTPQCIREDYHFLIFGSNLSDDVADNPFARFITFPISNQELLRRNRTGGEDGIRYFVVDCRRSDLYRKGAVFGSFHLDASLMVDEPSQFAIAVNSLKMYKAEKRADDHICFVGYGDEEADQHMVMVIAKFLADSVTHISVLEGGYKALHSYLAALSQCALLSGHDAANCEQCGTSGVGGGGAAAGVSSLMSRLSRAVVSKSSSVKERMSDMASARAAEAAHVSAKDRHGKKYRKSSQVFTLDGDSDEDAVSSPSVFTPKLNDVKERLDIALFITQREVIDKFECQELIGDKAFPAHIVLTRTHMHILHNCPDFPGFATTSARLLLSTVAHVSSRKKIPEVLTFKFGYEAEKGEEKITAIHRFYVPKAGECASAVKSAIYAIRPPLTPT